MMEMKDSEFWLQLQLQSPLLQKIFSDLYPQRYFDVIFPSFFALTDVGESLRFLQVCGFQLLVSAFCICESSRFDPVEIRQSFMGLPFPFYTSAAFSISSGL
jgi:hypothetical protein